MQLQPIFQTVNLTLPKTQLLDHIKCDAKTEVASETIKKLLNVSVFPTVQKNQVEDGKLKYLVRTVFYVSYVDADDQIKKYECSTEYSGELFLEEQSSRVVIQLFSEKVETDLSGINLKLSALILVKAVSPRQTEIKAFSGGENLMCNNVEKAVKKGFGIKEGVYAVEEQFSLPYVVEEVLFHRAEPIVTAVQCGVGCIIVDGEVRLTAILLQKSEKNDIIKEVKKFPFRVEMEYEDAMPSFTAISKVGLKSFKTDVEVDADGGKSQVSLSAMLTFNSQAYSVDTLSIATDVFCLSHEIQTEKNSVVVCDVDDVRSCQSKTNMVFFCDENPTDVTLKAIAGERVETLNVCVVNNQLSYSGTFNATAYFVNAEQKIFTKKIELPLEFNCDCAISDGCYLEAVALCECVNSSLSTNGIEIDLETTLTIYSVKQKEFNYITGVVLGGEKPQNQNAISVYIPYEGEELWSLAKRLNVAPETLEKTNPDLKFPLDGSERIVIYRQI